MRLLFMCSVLLLSFFTIAAPQTFEQAKEDARKFVYADQAQAGTLYCGCTWRWTGRSGGRVDLDSCGYEVRSNADRAARLEWEHIVPASNFGRARQCWQHGGRKHCNETDPVFNQMEADLHNLAPSIGEVNADRSNFDFGMLPGTPLQHGACPVKIDFKARTAEPRDAVKGMIARAYFYMYDRYQLRMSRQQQQLLLAWHHQFPVSAAEQERDRRIAAVIGHHNPFVTGDKDPSQLSKQLKPQRSGSDSAAQGKALETTASLPILGNRKSKVYHLPRRCPSYEKLNPQTAQSFDSEAQAVAAGYRKAGNCRS